MARRVMLIVPVFNEKMMLAEAKENGFFEALHRWEKRDSSNRKVLFVNDGSRDNTAKLVRAEEFSLINSDPGRKRNMGKGVAIIEGAKKAHGGKFEICVVLDLDITNLSARKIELFVRDLVKSKRRMIVARVSEGTGRKRNAPSTGIPGTTGERAFYTDAFKPVWENTKRKDRIYAFMHRMGADYGIHQLIKSWDLSAVSFSTAPPYRTISQKRQGDEGRVIWKRTIDRKNAATALRKMGPKPGDSSRVRKRKIGKMRTHLAGLKKRHRHLR